MDTRAIRPAMIEARLQRLFPDLDALEPITMLGSGFRSTVLKAAGERIFRIGNNEEAAVGYAKEARLLPLLQSHLPVPVPSPRWYAEPTEIFPFGVIGYPKVPGQSLAPNLPNALTRPLAAQLGQIMLALHRFPREAAADAGVPEWDAQERAGEWRDSVLPMVRAEMTRAEYTRIDQWWDSFLSDRVLREYEPALVHGDLWYEHVLVDQSRSRITSIVDFESARIGDPAQDFATQRHLGDVFASQALTAYLTGGGRAEATMDYRIQKLWELREFDGLHFAVRTGDTAEVEDAIRKLRGGPLLNVASREW